jgi:hypothetical protein
MITTPLQRSILLGLALIAGLSSITAMGVLNSSNIVMMDRLFQWLPNQQTTPPILLISTTESERNTPGLLQNLVKALNKDKPHALYLLGYNAMQALYAKQPEAGFKNLILVDSVTRLKQIQHTTATTNTINNGSYMTAITLQV